MEYHRLVDMPSFRFIEDPSEVDPGAKTAAVRAAHYASRDLNLGLITIMFYDASAGPVGVTFSEGDPRVIALKRGRTPLDTAATALHECRHVRDNLDGYHGDDYEDRAYLYAYENLSGLVGDPTVVILGLHGRAARSAAVPVASTADVGHISHVDVLAARG